MNALSKKLPALFALFLGLAWLPAFVLAEVPDRVGRIAYLAGNVQFYSETAPGWVAAELNAPVTSRNSLFTGPDGRAEVRFGGAAATLDANTQLDIPVLDDENFKARVTRGSVNFRIPALDGDDSYEVTASAARYQLLQEGRYRVDVENGGSSVSTFTGLLNAQLANHQVLVEAGKSLSTHDSGYQLAAARRTALDDFAEQRDDALRVSQATRYVSPKMTGYEELDLNGRWESDTDYGAVWYPTTYVTSDWAPYRDGRWAYVAPWGWTWIDAAPWGFAPFHYGRWVRIGSSWAWTPGTYVKRPSYAPALVAFIGGIPGATISIAARPSVSWYPLAPWESYRPSYRHSSQHLSSINNFRIKEPPSHAMRREGSQGVSVNQWHGRSEVPHATFVDPRAHGPRRPAAIPSATSTAPSTAPIAPSGRGHAEFGEKEFGEKRPAQDPWPESAARSRRGSVAERGGAPPLPPTESALRATPPVLSAPSEIPAGAFRRQENWQRGGAAAPAGEARPESSQNRFGAGRFGGRTETPNPGPSPSEPGASRMRVEPPAARSEPRIDLQNRGRSNVPEAQREPRRDPEKERAGGPERGHPGEGKARDQGPR